MMALWSKRGMILLLACFAFGASAAGGKDEAGEEGKDHGEASLSIFNRTIVTFRAPFLGMPPETRAVRARATVERLLRQGGDLEVAVKEGPDGKLIMLGQQMAFAVTTDDADASAGEDGEAAARNAARQLRRVVEETREARDLSLLLRDGAMAGGATLIFALLVMALTRARTWATEKLVLLAERKSREFSVGGRRIFETHAFLPYLQRLVDFVRGVVVALLAYQWVSFVLSSFPYTRPWGEQLNSYLYDLVAMLVESIVDALPGLIVAISIFLLAKFFIGFVGGVLYRLSARNFQYAWLNAETVGTTRRLVSIAIWLFALAMAYPYLPGAQSEAFKGLSVLLGVMVSLGASSLVGQGAAGLILTYTRTIRKGEYMRIGEHEGTVVDLGMFTTRLSTASGEELTLPNSMITSTVTRNFSRSVEGKGYLVDTPVSIGYDTPWRQVEAMLTEAARRTKDIQEAPPPRIFQTALSDYYPEYRLVAHAVPEPPRPRAEVISELHANIQDVFNEYGVPIMSPHYNEDPAEDKVVPPEEWYRPPARREEADASNEEKRTPEN